MCEHVWTGTNMKIYTDPPLYEMRCLRCGMISETSIMMHSEKVLTQIELETAEEKYNQRIKRDLEEMKKKLEALGLEVNLD